MKALLILSDGTVYEGQSVGAAGTATGEVVFNTAMTGYEEILTDPSAAGQLVALTYPLIGNYGINGEDAESLRPHLSGLIVREMCDAPSNYRSSSCGDEYLKAHQVVGIEGVDVRSLVKRLRDQGVMMGMITTEHSREEGLELLHKQPDYASRNYAREVGTSRPYQWQNSPVVPPAESEEDNGEEQSAQKTPGGKSLPEQWQMPLDASARIVVLDYGTKFNVLRSLRERGLEVVVLPGQSTSEEILSWQPDGVLLSSGPGDPSLLQEETENIRALLDQEPELPVFGICLGHLLLGRAFGAATKKLKFGHRGGNHPVKDLTTGKVHITAQNHGYVLDESTLDAEMEVTHISLNDQTIEGVRHKMRPVFSVQYRPEASPGPGDNAYLFDRFAESVKAKTTAVR